MVQNWHLKCSKKCTSRIISCYKTHGRPMLRILKYDTDTPIKDWMIIPTKKCDGKSQTIEIVLSGVVDSKQARCTDTQK